MARHFKTNPDTTECLVVSWCVLATIALFGVTFIPPAPTAESSSVVSTAPDEKVVEKTVSGHVSAVNARFIAVEYARDEAKGTALEMALPIDDAEQEHLKSTLAALSDGDTVLVTYKEISVKDARGDYANARRVATRVSLVARVASPSTDAVPATPAVP